MLHDASRAGQRAVCSLRVVREATLTRVACGRSLTRGQACSNNVMSVVLSHLVQDQKSWLHKQRPAGHRGQHEPLSAVTPACDSYTPLKTAGNAEHAQRSSLLRRTPACALDLYTLAAALPGGAACASIPLPLFFIALQLVCPAQARCTAQLAVLQVRPPQIPSRPCPYHCTVKNVPKQLA